MSTLKVDGIRSNSASSDAITLASDGTCTANITNNLSNRNLVINGAMQIAQRGTSSTSTGYATLDRFVCNYSATDEAPTQAHVSVASGTTPFTLGFKTAFKITNGNQTSGAGTNDFIRIRYPFEAQDISNSGWNYVSASSYITLSFWVKSSVAQSFHVNMRAKDGSDNNYTFETGSLSADTWTKITKTIPGNSNLTFDNNTDEGLYIHFHMFRGTGNTGTVSQNQWVSYDSTLLTTDQTSTWYTTNDATFELTGVQLEVGSTATDFEHRSYGDELRRCQRYFYAHSGGAHTVNGSDSSTPNTVLNTASCQSTSSISVAVPLPVPMRAVPTLYSTVAGSTRYRLNSSGANTNSGSDPVIWTAGSSHTTVQMDLAGFSGLSAGQAGTVRRYDGTGVLGFQAEI